MCDGNIIRPVTFAALLLSCGLFFSGCSKPQAPAEAFVAKVGDAHISLADFQRELQSRTSRPTPEQREATLQDMIRVEILYLRAKEAGFDAEAETKARTRRLIASAYEEKLRGAKSPFTNSPPNLEQYYREHIDDFTAPERVRLATVLLRVPSKATSEKKDEVNAKAQNLLAESKLLPATVVGFGDLARQHSDDQSSRYSGGDLGWLTQREAESKLGPEVAIELFKHTQPSELFGPIHAAQGIYIFKLIAREEAKPKSLAEVKELIAYKMARAAEQADQHAFDERLRAGLKIEINRSLIDSVDVHPKNKPNPPVNLPKE